MANDKFRPATGTPMRSVATPKLDKEDLIKRLSKNRSTIIIVTAVLLLVIFYAISSSIGNNSKYDVYSLNSELDFSSMNVEYKSFMELMAEATELVGIYTKDADLLAEADLNEILEIYVELLMHDIPESLISIKAASLDMINIHRRFLINSQTNLENYGVALSTTGNENVENSKLELSRELARIFR